MQNNALRAVLAAIASFLMFAALVSLPFASVPIAYIGLCYGLGLAIAAAILTGLLTSVLLSPVLGIVFLLVFLVPSLMLLRQSLLSRPIASDVARGDGAPSWDFYPAERLILMGGGLAAVGTIAIFASVADTPGGLPEILAQAMYSSPELADMVHQLYNTRDFTDFQLIARLIIITGLAGWPLLLLGNLQIGQALAVLSGKNLRPTPDYDRLQLPPRLVFLLAGFGIGTLVFDGTLSTLMAIFLALVTSAYFLLGLAIIHAISRPWNGRGWLLSALYFLIFIMAWVIIPIALIGLLDTRFDFRQLASDGTGKNTNIGSVHSTDDTDKDEEKD
ncbi:MAG: DUF2232 domain-containing protein [Parvibaculales bacterium]